MIKVFKVVRRKKRKDIPFDSKNHEFKNFSLQKIGCITINDFLNKQNIILHTFDFKEKKAYFASIKDANELSYMPFVRDYVYDNCHLIYEIPFDMFFYLSEYPALKNNISHVKVAQCVFTPRSGSTLLCRSLAKVQDICVLSEPLCIHVIERQYNTLTSDTAIKFYKATLAFLRYGASINGKSLLFIKPFASVSTRVIDKALGYQTKKVFLVRKHDEVMISFLQKIPYFYRFLITYCLPKSVNFNMQISRLSLSIRQEIEENYNYKNLNIEEFTLLLAWMPLMKNVIFYQQCSPNAPCFEYHKFVGNPKCSMKKILDYLCYNRKYLQRCAEEFSHDSQRGTFLSMSRQFPLRSKEKIKFLNRLDKKFLGFLAKKYFLDYQSFKS